MSVANPNPMEKSMVSVLVVVNAGGGSPLPCGVSYLLVAGHWFVGVVGSFCWPLARRFRLPGGLQMASTMS
jgi:hypothetical protein